MKNRLYAALTVLVVAVAAAFAQDTDPILRIETDFHSSMIWAVGASDDGSVILTTGTDKVMRSWRWDGRTLSPEAVYRIPIGAGHEAKLYAAAVSPNGRYLLAGGWTGYEWDGSNSIYVVDRNVGDMTRRIAGLPNVINDIIFNDRGDKILACLNGGAGVYAFDLATGAELWHDDDYGANSNDGCAVPGGGWVTTCYDGKIRRYTSKGRLTDVVDAPDGDEPYSVDYQDGKLIVGYNDQKAAVTILDADNLGTLERLRIDPDDKGRLYTVAAGHGKWWAAGDYFSDGEYPLAVWENGGEMISRFNGLTNAVFDIQAIPGGMIVTGTAPELQIVDTEGNLIAGLDSPICDLRGKREGSFRVDASGRRLWFGRAEWDGSPMLLDLVDGDAGALDEPPDDLEAPRHRAKGWNIEGWINTRDVTVNGNHVDLENYEIARAVAIPKGQNIAVIGADWNLMAVDRDGEKLWERDTAGTVWGVHCPDDVPVVVAAYGDGIIRWHRLSDGEEILACFPHRDGRRWVAWTPSGYYWAGPGSEDLIGWHINRGPDVLADYFPAGRFRDRFNRPDIVQAVFETWDEGEAIAMADRTREVDKGSIAESLPPVVEILSPAPDAEFSRSRMTLRLRLRTFGDAPVSEIRVLFDGREVGAERGLRVAASSDVGDIREIDVNLPGQSGLLSVVATNGNGASVPATRQLIWTGSNAFDIKPVCYVLAVGVDDYDDDDILDLSFPGSDAAALAGALERQEGLLFRQVETRVVANGDRGEVMRGLSWLKSSCTNRDLAVVFLAGHGENDDQGDYYFLPSDTDVDDFFSTAVPFTAIMRTIQSLPGKRLAFLDTCRAGNVTGGRRRAVGNASDQALNLLSSAENGCVVFAAATGSQSAIEDDSWGHGAFTLALTEALEGRAPTDVDPFLRQVLEQPVMTVNMLNLYIAERVKQLTGGLQHSTMERPATVPDFPIAVRE